MTGYASYIAMIFIQIAYGGSNILIKIALEKGLNQLVLVAYRHVVAMFVLFPFAFVLERRSRPSLSFSVMLKIFVMSSLGTTVHLNVYYAGLHYVSPTVASALSNVIPSLTFVTAVILRMETVKIREVRGQAKVVGTVICVGGALLFTFWKGGVLLRAFVERPLIHVHATGRHEVNWVKGSSLILVSHVAWSAWLILQAAVIQEYPARLSLNVLICFFASLQSFVLALFFARNLSLWRLNWDVQLLTVAYCGVVLSSGMYYLQTWCISVKGPVFVAMFIPLLLVFVGIFSSIAFAERLHLSSLVGAFLIVGGLYCVLWGKSLDTASATGKGIEKQRNENEALQICVQQQESRGNTS